MKLGELLKKVRLEKRLTLREAAEHLGMDHTYLYRLEEGSRLPRDNFLQPIAQFLNLYLLDLVSIVVNEKVQAQMQRINLESSSNEIKDLSYQVDEIEDIATRDRSRFLQSVGRDYFRFPRDRNLIPQLLYGLTVVYDDILFGPSGRQIYAGLFPKGYDYNGESNVIVIATQSVRKGSRKIISDQTMTFHVLHELGHFQLHQSKTQSENVERQPTNRPLYCSSGDISPTETNANKYASSFLMPRHEIEKIMEGKRSIHLKKSGKDLCEHFFVEIWTLRYRLESLGYEVFY